jgi:hypothetical protein
MIALRAIAPLHHPLNRYAVTGGALRRVLVDIPYCRRRAPVERPCGNIFSKSALSCRRSLRKRLFRP